MKKNPAPLVAMVALLAAPALAEMDASQQKWFEEATRYVGTGEESYNLAASGIGSGPVSPSKAKLALVRLGSAKQALANATARIEKLPADDAGVVALKDRAGKLQQAVTDLEKRLTDPAPAPKAPDAPAAPETPGQPDAPKSDPAPAPPATPAAPAQPADEGVKLDYKQEEALKNARFHVRDVAGKAAALAKVAEEVKGAADTNLVPIGRLQSAMTTFEDVHRKEKNAADQLAAVPANGRGVPEIAKALEDAKASVIESEKVIAPAYEKLVAALDPKNHPQLADDLKRLSDLSAMYSSTDILQTDRPRAAAAITEIPQAAKEHDRIIKDYTLLMQQQTDLGKRLTGTSNHFKAKVTEFIEAANQQKASLPKQIDEDLGNCNKLAEQAVAEKKPLFFTGGIPQNLDFATDKLVLLQALDADAAKLAADKIDKTKADLKTKQQSLSEGIINGNTLPADAYTGADRKKIDDMAVEAWKKEQPDAEVLMVRIPAQNWKRETMWRYQNSWYFIDRSKLQAQLIVKHNDTLAVIRPINLWIDHTSNDEYKAFPMDGIADDLIPQRFMLLEKVK